jgi:DNA-binding NarL/FixJ family response regulator
MKPYRIVVADDHRLLCDLIKKCIEEVPGLKVVGTTGDGLELLEFLKKSTVDMIILDISMPNLQGIGVSQQIKKLYPEIKILILTMHKTEEHIIRALSAGADGYLVKENSYNDLIAAIDTVRQGKKYITSLISDLMANIIRQQSGGRQVSAPAQSLTAREKEVLRFIAEGKTTREIAVILSITPLTVDHHRRNIMKKLNLKKNVDLVKYAIQYGYITVPPL